jgi:hypothetical protein
MRARIEASATVLALLTLSLVALPELGCRKNVAEKASESDSNGYVCKDGHKFYAPRKLFADKCPACGTLEISEVYGYVCEIDPVAKPENFKPGCGAVTLAARNAPKVDCSKCGKPVHAVMLPSGKDLEAWGATKATREQVLLNP